jgi:hypothetical protein
MKAKQISDRSVGMTQEENLFAEVLEKFDYCTDKIVSFFSDFLDLTPSQIKVHADPHAKDYHKIAKQMLPLDA